MGLTRAERHNRMLDRIMGPEIERLKGIEEKAKKIMAFYEQRTEVDYCGLKDWQVINELMKIIDGRS